MSLPIHSHCKNGLMYEVTNAVPNTMKTTVAYVEMARLARELLENANIRAIITDFEQPLRTAFREAFHNSHLVGCYFHHIRCLMGYIHRLRLTRVYQEVPQVNAIIKRIEALAFLPAGRINAKYQEIISQILNEILVQFAEFFRYYTWRMFYLGDITSSQLLTIAANLIGNNFSLRLRYVTQEDIIQALELEQRFIDALPVNIGPDPEYDFTIHDEFRTIYFNLLLQ
uniref:MULE transposase domain-containing protein n=1 Tax=Trichogramma kaykai TaxID=54128 RepID=A0ABD2WK15_9HYME